MSSRSITCKKNQSSPHTWSITHTCEKQVRQYLDLGPNQVKEALSFEDFNKRNHVVILP